MNDISNREEGRITERPWREFFRRRPFLAFGFLAAFLSFFGAFGVESWLLFCILSIAFVVFLAAFLRR